MKKVSLPVLIVLSVTLGSCVYDGWNQGISGNGNVIEESRDVSGFNGVHVSSGIDVYLTEGKDFELRVEADENLMEVILTELKDDMLVINPIKKLTGQLIAAGLIIVMGDIRIDHFHGVLGLEEIPFLASVFFTIFVFIVIINGFNLIDGIDGLASGVGALVAFTLGIWFWMAGTVPYSVLSFALAGSLIAFFYFNVFSKKNKIFLGDAGSLIVGFTISIITIQFLNFQVPI